ANLAATAAVILALIGIYLLFILPTQWVYLARVRHPAGIGKRIVQVSDIHVEKLNITHDRLCRMIAGEQPDYIFLTGDFTEKHRHLPKVDRLLTKLKTIPAPIYAVLGNHDYRMGDEAAALLELFRAHDIPVLRNESVRLDGFTL